MKKKPPVLIVDDEWVIRQQLARALDSAGVACDCAIDGEDALRKIAGHQYELVVTDLRMPERNGHSLAVALLNSPWRPKVVALTGVTEPRIGQDLLDRGVEEIVYKPVDYFDLADRLKRLLERTRPTLPVPAADIETHAEAPDEERPATTEALQRARLRLEAKLIEAMPKCDWIVTALRSIDWHGFENPVAELTDFLQRLSRPAPYGLVERRRSVRIAMKEIAIAIPLDERFEPLADPFKLVVRDLSRRGIGLVHSKLVEGSYLALMWRSKERKRVVVLVHVTRCRLLSGFYDIGGELVW
jgi:DNA-binding response OmpR family regulator